MLVYTILLSTKQLTISQAFQLSGIMILPNNANLYCKNGFKGKRLVFRNVRNETKTPEEFDRLTELVNDMRFAMLDSDTARFQGACGVAFVC